VKTIGDLVVPLRKAIHPVFFNTGVDDYQYSGMGTCFLIMLAGKRFAITLEHIVEPMRPNDIVIFPNAPSVQPLVFSQKINPTFHGYPDIQAEEIRLLAVDKVSFKSFDRFCSPFLVMAKAPNDWVLNPKDYEYIVYGYPNSDRDIVYEQNHLKAIQHSVICNYTGKSMIKSCLELTVNSLCGPS